jgi:pyruvate/2-oxoglutarate dehydrogenase complex dihydrolipoamide dehydrogenase (E3) component
MSSTSTRNAIPRSSAAAATRSHDRRPTCSCDRQTDRIIGAHTLGHVGEELIHIFPLAMKHGITASDIKDLIYGFPTFSADLKSLW